MKLYSRWHVVLFSVLAAAGVLGLAAILGYLRVPTESASDGDGSSASSLVESGSQTVTTGGGAQYSGNPSYGTNLPEYLTESERNNIRIYESLNEGVVHITSISLTYNWFLDPIPQEGTGSGSIIDRDGHIVTNHHVIKNADNVLVTLANGTEYRGDILGVDQESDLAVIRIRPASPLVAIPLGSSAGLRVGQKVLAIGNPFALDRTLTTGVVSGLGRAVRVESGLIIGNMIQTDASINPGNSGGPLLNSRGEMIGINTIIRSKSGESIGIGFAVPIDSARRVVDELIKYGKVRRGWIDISHGVQLFPALARLNGSDVSKGILVSKVSPGSNAQEAGFRGGDPERYVRYQMRQVYLGGDVITAVDGMTISSLADLYNALEDNKPGETVEAVVRRGRREVVLTVVLSDRPSQFPW